MAGRPKEFDRDQVLTNAMKVFWANGYSATSIRDLEEETGIGRQSLYNEFGDKDQLFVAAVEHYDRTVTQKAIEILTAEGSPNSNIRRWLQMLIGAATAKDRRGCMLTNATMSVAITDETMRNATADVGRRLEKAIRFSVVKAIELGELPESTDIPSMTSYVLSIAQGILVLGRMGKSKAKLNSVMDVSLQAFSA